MTEISFEDINSKTVEIEILDNRFPDDVQGFLVYAETLSGRTLNDKELDFLNDSFGLQEYISEIMYDL